MLRASLRGLLSRKLRLTLAVVAIVLGVGFLSGALVLTDTLGARFTKLFEAVNQNVAVQVRVTEEAQEAENPPRMSQEELDRLADLPGVRAVSGDVNVNGVVPFGPDGKAKPSSTGTNLGVGVTSEEDPFSLVQLAEGRNPNAAGEVALSRYTAKEVEVGVGDQVKLYLPEVNEARQFTVVGLTTYSGDRDTLGGEYLVLFQMAEAQKLFYGREGVYSGAYLSAESGTSEEELRDAAARIAPTGFEALTGKQLNDESATEVSDQLGAITKYFFGPFAGIAVLVGIFLIFNTFNIVVAQRARELALFRAMGASWSQVTGSVLVEALIVGVVGSTLGLLAGVGLGWAGGAALGSFLNLQLPDGGLVVAPLTIALAYGVGVLVTVVAAFVPAVRASAVPPLAAMREVSRPDKPLRTLSIVGACFLLPGIAMVVLTAVGQSFWFLIPGVLLSFIGAVLLSPLLARPVVALVGRALAWGTSGKLGVRNAARNPRRTAVTATALMIGVTLVSAVTVVGTSFKQTVQDLVSTSFGAQVIIQTQFQGPPSGDVGFDPRRLAEVLELPGVRQAEALHLAEATVGGRGGQFVAAGDLPAMRDMFAMETVTGELGALGDDELVVDNNTAGGLGWKVGDTAKITLPAGGERSYTVAGIYEATPLVTGVLLGEGAVRNFGGPLAAQGYVVLDEGADTAAVTAGVERLMADYPLVTVGDQADLIERTNQFIDIALGIVTVLLAVAILIAFLGILNTLLLSVFERTRELGLLRAIGLGRGGVTRMVSVESILIAVFGCLLGIALGVGLGVGASAALIERDFLSTIALPWLNLAVFVLVAVFAGVIAALWPAWRAARLNVLEAIAYE
ncbi:MAG TPA: FtsX-like permease family protein [Pilimelia sp.]|nr:FtsX-like permease family protein [Pilimelia sp.]